MKVEYTPAALALDAGRDQLARVTASLLENAGRNGDGVAAVWDRTADDEYGPRFVIRASTPDGSFERVVRQSDLPYLHLREFHALRTVGEILRLRTERIAAGMRNGG